MKIAILILFILIILVSGCTQTKIVTLNQTASGSPAETPSLTSTPKAAEPDQNHITGFNHESLPKYASRYYRYNKEAYQAAVGEGKVVYLYFYANWCPICKEARPKILDAFNKMDFDDVIGFEVHFNDDQVTDEDKQITRNYQVPYQHTTIIAKNGKQVFKSLEELSTEKLIEEIRKVRGK